MKKSLFLLFVFFFVLGTAYASINGNGIHFDVNDEFIQAFENCKPYQPKVLNIEDLAKNDIPEEYESIEIKGEQSGECLFDLIMQMSSVRLYTKVVKRCKIKMGTQEQLLRAIQNIYIDKGRQYIKETAKIMDQCRTISDITENNLD